MIAYDKSYYTGSNYASYLERQERYERMMQELHHDLFRRIKLDFTDKLVVDYGCAVGFTVRSLVDLGYQNVLGYDISDWAVNYGRDVLNLHDKLTTDYNIIVKHQNERCELMMSFDVFEHMKPDDVRSVLLDVQPTYLLVRIPLAENTGGKFVLAVSENDPTHITRFTRNDWHRLMSDVEMTWLFDVNVGLFYDTAGVMCSMFRRESR